MLKKFDTVLFEALVEKKLTSKEALEPIARTAEGSGTPLLALLLKQGLFAEKDILGALAEKLKIGFISLENITVDKSVIDKVPVKIATYYKFIPVSLKDRLMTIAMPTPLDIKTQDEIRTQLGYDIEVALATQNDILDSLKKYYGLAADTLEKIVSQTIQTPSFVPEASQQKVEDIDKSAEDASVIKLVNQIILEAYRKRATDIHIEPYRGEVGLRYRIDGLLYDTNVPPEIKNFLSAIISRIKIMSNLNIVERRLPQDGRAVVKVQEGVLDLRVSTIPTPYGESIVIRILPTKMLFSLERLGLTDRELQIFESLVLKPHGIIFVTGPTGSGKTTTLYACLSRINTKERKIITIEDPIEYEMTGITQIQVMPEIGLDFARGLRSMLRHDPDVMMVGEVRDLETAEIAIRVALTGHLVFSTLHTNDAASGITRLIDIGLEPYLVASSVVAFIAQRLIRVSCPDCRYEDSAAPAEVKELIAKDLGIKLSEVKIFRSKGCANCNFTGFFGRTAIYEIILIDEDMKDLIVKKVTASHIKKLALSKGMRTLRQDGWRKVILGVTTPEEVMKVTSAEEEPASEKKTEFSLNLPIAGDERRVYSRLSSKVNLNFKIFKPNEKEAKELSEQFSVTKNISAGGLLFTSDSPFPLGSVLELKVKIPYEEEPVECLSRVIRVEEVEAGKNYNVAVCFLDLTSAQRARLDKYVELEGK